jgi:peptide/nickel transport system permease protein
MIYIVRRILYAAPVALGVALLVFLLVHIAPGDPISAILPPDAPQELVTKLKAYYGFDKPLPIQFLRWLFVVMQGDFGTSIASGRPVADIIGRSLVNTLILAASASIVAFSLASVLGTLAAYARRPIVDRLITAISITGVSVPHYWLAMVLVIVFSVELGVLPPMGIGPDGAGGWRLDLPHLAHMVLPTIALSVIPLGIATRSIRATMRETLNQEFVTALRAKGLRRRDGLAARQPDRRLDPDRDRVLVAWHRLFVEQRDLRQGSARPARHHPGAGNVLRQPQPDGRHGADADRPPHQTRLRT